MNTVSTVCRFRHTKHRIQPCILHSCVPELQQCLDEASEIKQIWEISLPTRQLREGFVTTSLMSELYPNCRVMQDTLEKSLLLLSDIGENFEAFEFLCKENIPFIVECRRKLKQDFWSPQSLALCFGESEGTVLDTITKAERTMKLKEFFSNMSSRRQESKERYKITDFPEEREAIKMQLTVPSVVKELYSIMPFKRYLHPNGPLNLATYVHWAMHKPDHIARFFSGDGSLTGTTPLHTDLTDAANICVHAESCPEGELEAQNILLDKHFPEFNEAKLRGRPAALWHVFHPDAYEGVKT